MLNLHLTSLSLLSIKEMCFQHDFDFLIRVRKVFRKGEYGQCLSLGGVFNAWSAAVCAFPLPSMGCVFQLH